MPLLKAGVMLSGRRASGGALRGGCIRRRRQPLFAHERGRLSVRAVPVFWPNFLLSRGGGTGAAGDKSSRLLDPAAGGRTRAGLGLRTRPARPLSAGGKAAGRRSGSGPEN